MKTIPDIVSPHENRDILIAFAQICSARAACNARVAKRTTSEKNYATIDDLAVRAARAAACVQDAPTHELATHHASEAARYAVETARAFYSLHLGQSSGELIANGEHAKQIEDICSPLASRVPTSRLCRRGSWRSATGVPASCSPVLSMVQISRPYRRESWRSVPETIADVSPVTFPALTSKRFNPASWRWAT